MQSRRKFIITTAKATTLVAVTAATGVSCNDKQKGAGTVANGRKNNYKKKTVAATLATVQLRGWQQHSKTKTIHYFDHRGFTPALWYVKDKTQLDQFLRNLTPFDADQLSMDVYNKQVSKKYGQWVAEYAALAMASRGRVEDAFSILKNGIEKRPVNYRLWDLAAALAYTPGHEVVRNSFQTLLTQYSAHNDQRLRSRIEKYATGEWQQKRLHKPGSSWNKQNIRAEVF